MVGRVITSSVLIVIARQVLPEHDLMDALYGIVTAVFGYAVAWFWLEHRPARHRLDTLAGTADVVA